MLIFNRKLANDVKMQSRVHSKSKADNTLIDTLYCFYEHVLQSIHYAVCPFESWLLYRSYKETCEWLCNKP